MKTTTLILLLFVTAGIDAQKNPFSMLPLKDGKVMYTAVVPAENISKDELYKRAKRWLAVDAFKSNTNVIQFDDKENGEIIGKGFFVEEYCILGCAHIVVWQTVKIQMKDGRYKYEIADFRLKYLYPEKITPIPEHYDEVLEEWNENKNFYSAMDITVKALIDSLEKTMKIPIDYNW